MEAGLAATMNMKPECPEGRSYRHCLRDAPPGAMGRVFLLLVAVFVGNTVLPADLYTSNDGARVLSLHTSAKSSSLLARAPSDPVLFPERDNAIQFLRLRLELGMEAGDTLSVQVAYEQRLRLTSSTGGAGAGGYLPSTAQMPFRIHPLDWPLQEDGSRLSYRHEMDRANISFRRPWGGLVVGRQAIGLGRGVLFGAVDLFSPFSPLQVDREWRPGVDAARLEVNLADTVSADIAAVFGETQDEGALIGRIRGYVGRVDGALVLGTRADDEFIGLSTSAAISGAEFHADGALFRTPERQDDGGSFGREHMAPKLVVGSSYTFGLGTGLTLLGEYHYSGFGVRDITDALPRLADPTFRTRYVRGDMQILSRHATATQLNYQFTEALSGACLALCSPRDGSGVASPSLLWDVSDNIAIAATVFMPWGAKPNDGELHSEYGGGSRGVFLHVTAHY